MDSPVASSRRPAGRLDRQPGPAHRIQAFGQSESFDITPSTRGKFRAWERSVSAIQHHGTVSQPGETRGSTEASQCTPAE